MMELFHMEQIVLEANRTLRNADTTANSMAALLVGRLRHVDGPYLEELKRELKDFNIQTHQWKDK